MNGDKGDDNDGVNDDDNDGVNDDAIHDGDINSKFRDNDNFDANNDGNGDAIDHDKLTMPPPLRLPVMIVGPTKFPSGYSGTVAPRPSSIRVAPSSTADWIREQIRS